MSPVLVGLFAVFALFALVMVFNLLQMRVTEKHHALRPSDVAGADEVRCRFSIDGMTMLSSLLGRGRLVVTEALVGLRCSQGDFVFRRGDDVRIAAPRRRGLGRGRGTLRILGPSLSARVRVPDLEAILATLRQRGWAPVERS